MHLKFKVGQEDSLAELAAMAAKDEMGRKTIISFCLDGNYSDHTASGCAEAMKRSLEPLLGSFNAFNASDASDDDAEEDGEDEQRLQEEEDVDDERADKQPSNSTNG